jgi:hypothetical protein
MPDEAATKLRINLARWNCFQFRITTEMTLSDDIVRTLGIDPKRRFHVLHEAYNRDQIAHSMTMRLVRLGEQQNRYGVRLVYETESPKEPGTGLMVRQTKPSSSKVSEIFLRLCRVESLLLFRCDCSFSYRREEKGIYFPLPIKIEDELFDEVRGIKLVKLQQDKILLENYVDLVEPNLMIHRVKFLHEGKCTIDLPQKLLRQARKISKST